MQKERINLVRLIVSLMICFSVLLTSFIQVSAQAFLKNSVLISVLSDQKKKDTCLSSLPLLDNKNADIDFFMVLMELSSSYLRSLPDSDKDEFKGVLERYKNSSDEQKTQIKDAIRGFNFNINVDTQGFEQIRGTFNELVTGNVKDGNGSKFIVSLFQYMYSSCKQPFIFDGTDGEQQKIKFSLANQSNLISTINSFLNITELFKSSNINDLNGLLSQMEQNINAYPGEVVAFKRFMEQKTTGIYREGIAPVFTPTLIPTSTPTPILASTSSTKPEDPKDTQPTQGGVMPNTGAPSTKDSASQPKTGATTSKPETAGEKIENDTSQTGTKPTAPGAMDAMIERAIESIVKEKSYTASIQIAKETIDLINPQDLTGSGGASVRRDLLEITKTALSKNNTQEIVAKVLAGVETATLGSEGVETLIQKMDTIVKDTTEMNTKLQSMGLEEKVEAVLNIKIVPTGEADANQINIPVALVNHAREKRLDKIEFQTELATVCVAVNTIELKDSKDISISITKVKKEEFSEEIRKTVDDNQIFNFTLALDGKKQTTFNQYIQVSLPYVLKPGEDPEKLTVFYITENNQLENVIGNYNKALKCVIFKTNHFSMYVIKNVKATFVDIGSYTWAQKAIEVMASKGIIQGIGKGTYVPSSFLTRAQFATMLVKQSKLLEDNAPNSFKDVGVEAWYSKAVASAFKHGLIKGRTSDTFDPDASVSRQEMAVMIYNTLKIMAGRTENSKEDYLSTYTDKNEIADYAKPAVNYISKYGVMKGQEDGSFVPKRMATRAEAAVVIYAIFNIIY